jgi:hypothetical protein
MSRGAAFVLGGPSQRSPLTSCRAGIGGDVDQGTVGVDVGAGEPGEFAEARADIGGGNHLHAGVKVRHARCQARQT